jgi:hypothetical protein
MIEWKKWSRSRRERVSNQKERRSRSPPSFGLEVVVVRGGKKGERRGGRKEVRERRTMTDQRIRR